ncbi:hypothetical protein R1flu_023734 [Riccia fluitans]|uniref:Uncharacterized protein n=1 Tax=Riccia fluitans TaxID=41844 RepID=A0ABD1XT18_9MARC
MVRIESDPDDEMLEVDHREETKKSSTNSSYDSSEETGSDDERSDKDDHRMRSKLLAIQKRRMVRRDQGTSWKNNWTYEQSENRANSGAIEIAVSRVLSHHFLWIWYQRNSKTATSKSTIRTNENTDREVDGKGVPQGIQEA